MKQRKRNGEHSVGRDEKKELELEKLQRKASGKTWTLTAGTWDRFR